MNRRNPSISELLVNNEVTGFVPVFGMENLFSCIDYGRDQCALVPLSYYGEYNLNLGLGVFLKVREELLVGNGITKNYQQESNIVDGDVCHEEEEIFLLDSMLTSFVLSYKDILKKNTY